MEDKLHLVHTPDQILRRVSIAMAIGMTIIVALFVLTGDGASGIPTEILAAES